MLISYVFVWYSFKFVSPHIFKFIIYSCRQSGEEQEYVTSAREKFGDGQIVDYKDYTKDPFLILFGVDTKKIFSSRIGMLKSFLAAVFKVPPEFLCAKDEKGMHLNEMVDLVRLVLLCTIETKEPLLDLKFDKGRNYDEDIGFRHPTYHRPEKPFKCQTISLTDHYSCGRLFGLEVIEDAKKEISWAWTTTIDQKKMEENMYKQFRLEITGISPSTLLMFVGVGAVDVQTFAKVTKGVQSSYTFLYPQMAVTIDEFNQRAISDMGRVWKELSENDDREGLMQIMYKEEYISSFGNIPYILYPHHEMWKDPTYTNQDEVSFKLASTIKKGSDIEDIFTDNRVVRAHDIDFESICCAYKAIFGVHFTDVYAIDNELQNFQLLAILAMGCLIRDVDRLCNGFQSPFFNLPAIHKYLNKRIYDMLNPTLTDETFRDEFEIFCIGRNIPEAFWRIRLMFRFLMGDVYHGLVDGYCRITTLAFTWVGLKPEQSFEELTNPKPRRQLGRPNYIRMTTPSPVHLIMSGNYARKDGRTGQAISRATLDLCEENSRETQRSYSLGEDLSVQSFILDILNCFKKGIPFTNTFRSEHLNNSDLFPPINEPSAKATEEKLREITKEKILRLIYAKMQKVKQKDIEDSWRMGTQPCITPESQMTFLRNVKFNAMSGFYRILIDMMVRFLLLGCVMEEYDDDDRSFGKSMIKLLIAFVENNGTSWQRDGDKIRQRTTCITNPMDFKVTEGKKLLLEERRADLWETLIKHIDDIQLDDPNRSTSLMVSFCWCEQLCY